MSKSKKRDFKVRPIQAKITVIERKGKERRKKEKKGEKNFHKKGHAC